MTTLAAAKSSRVALFGGSFNPPHLGHEVLVSTLLERELTDEVWIVPVWQHPFGKPLCPFEDRLAMCRLAFARFGPRVQVSDLERELGGPSYTVRTLEALRAARPGDELQLVVGADTLKDTGNWRDFPRVRALARLLVVPRAGEAPAMAAAMAKSPEALNVPAPPGVSSSDVRRRLASGESVAGMLSEDVRSYAVTRGLYRAAAVGDSDSKGSANQTEG